MSYTATCPKCQGQRTLTHKPDKVRPCMSCSRIRPDAETWRCGVEGCDRTDRRKEYCTSHYIREWRRRNAGQRKSANCGASPEELDRQRVERSWQIFWSNIKKTESCWVYTNKLDPAGYGRCMLLNRSRYVHVVTWEQAHGPVPNGLELDHLCRNRACCNPDHLEPVTHRENVKRGSSHVGEYIRRYDAALGQSAEVAS